MIQRYVLDSDSRLIFFHVPKTAGVTVRNTIGNRFSEAETLHILNPRAYLEEHPGSEVEAALSRHRFIHGHFDLSFLRYVREPVYKMVLVREPVARICSLYWFLRGHSLDKYAGPEDARKRIWYAQNTSFEDFVGLDEPELIALSNYQVRFLAGRIADARGKASGERELVDAQRNLEGLEYFGITDRMRESVDLLCYQFGLFPVRDIMRLNATPGGYEAEISSSARARIVERNEWDIALYRHAFARFEERYRGMIGQMLEEQSNQDRAHRKGEAGQRVILTMDQAIDGDGWYNRETDGNGVTWRFTGPGSVSTLMLSLAWAARIRCTVHIYHAVSRLALDSLEVRVNGVPVPLETAGQENTGIVRTGIVPANALRREDTSLKVEFCVAAVARPVDVSPGSADCRLLGVAVSRLELVPE